MWEGSRAVASMAEQSMLAQPAHSGPSFTKTNQSQDVKTSQQQHTRTYQACIPCRKRKVRCDLGPVDNPHDPPCARCKRESKECFFSNTRRRRRDEDEDEEFDEHDPDNFEVHKNRKIRRSFGSSDVRESPLTPGGSTGRNYPLKRPMAEPITPSDEEDQEVNNDTAALLQKTEVFSGHDALNLLYQAAGHAGDIKQHRSASGGSLPRPSFLSNTGTPVDTRVSPQARPSHPTGGTPGPAATPGSSSNPKDTSVGSATARAPRPNGHSDGLGEASKAWMKLRFVRAGWFTASEAILYIDYFYNHLSPMTPIPVPDFHKPSMHAKLLAEEPMLAVTLLTVASRHARLSGPGAESRAYAIHEKLWTYLQGMIDRMIWGQEQFGGGFCGAGFKRGDGSKGLRTIGTIESLLILTEWHPRALHFPPGDDNDELIIGEEETGGSFTPTINLNDASSNGRIDSWLEPCWRSDRMSWSLLANAIALAYELGILSKRDNDSNDVFAGQPGSEMETSSAQDASARRMENVRRLLYVYVNLTAGRLSLPSMLLEEHCKFSFPTEVLDAAENPNLANAALSPEADNNHQLELAQDVVLYFWCKLVGDIIKAGNRELFPSREFTRELINNNSYATVMDKFLGLLKDLRMKFDSCPIIPNHMRHVLNIEFEYAKVYISTLGLQAIIERCTNNKLATEQQTHPIPASEQSEAQRATNAIISAQMLRKWLGTDWKYIQEIIGGSRNLLQVIVDGLYPKADLKHATVRTYFRINAVSMVLLKTFAVGATGNDFAVSVKLMDKAADALRKCIVDDVHVGARFAQLLSALNRRVRSRIVRITANGESSANGSRAQSPVREGDIRRQDQQSQQQIATTNPMNARTLQGGATQRSPNSSQRQQQSYIPPNNINLGNQYHPYHSSTMNYGNTNNNQHAYLPYAQRQAAQYHNHRRNTSLQADPLAGILPSQYDQANPQFSIMPPPSFMRDSYATSPHLPESQYATSSNNTIHGANSNNADDAFMSDDSNFFGTIPGDWMALPLDPLLNNVGADVTQTGYGPDVGGLDMLDILLQDDGQDGNGIGGWQR